MPLGCSNDLMCGIRCYRKGIGLGTRPARRAVREWDPLDCDCAELDVGSVTIADEMLGSGVKFPSCVACNGAQCDRGRGQAGVLRSGRGLKEEWTDARD